jgi:hypothetical protein
MLHSLIYCQPLCYPTHLKACDKARQEAVKVRGQELATDKITPTTPSSAPFTLGAHNSRRNILHYWMPTQYLATRMPPAAVGILVLKPLIFSLRSQI